MDFKFDIESKTLEITKKISKGGTVRTAFSDLAIALPKVESGLDIRGVSDELILQIFQNLNLADLAACSTVCARWAIISMDRTLYVESLLKSIEMSVNLDLVIFFFKNWSLLENLRISVYCVDPTTSSFIACFLEHCCQQLTTLIIECGIFLNQKILQQIEQCENLTVLCIKSTRINPSQYDCLTNLKHLKTLDLTATNITDDALISILKNNPDLEHLIIGLCNFIRKLDEIVSTVVKYNQNLKSWRSQRLRSLTSLGFAKFSECLSLQELNLKYCLVPFVQSDFENMTPLSCPQLEELVIWEWHNINDAMLSHILSDLKNVKHLELCFNNNISVLFTVLAHEIFPKLEILSISPWFAHDRVMQQYEFESLSVIIENMHVCNLNYKVI